MPTSSTFTEQLATLGVHLPAWPEEPEEGDATGDWIQRGQAYAEGVRLWRAQLRNAPESTKGVVDQLRRHLQGTGQTRGWDCTLLMMIEDVLFKDSKGEWDDGQIKALSAKSLTASQRLGTILILAYRQNLVAAFKLLIHFYQNQKNLSSAESLFICCAFIFSMGTRDIAKPAAADFPSWTEYVELHKFLSGFMLDSVNCVGNDTVLRSLNAFFDTFSPISHCSTGSQPRDGNYFTNSPTGTLPALSNPILNIMPEPKVAKRNIKIIIFNACSNGNWGDALQSEAARAILIGVKSENHDLQIDAISQKDKNSFYHFCGNKIRNELISDTEFINEYDALIIGGGGLFAAKHRPLDSASFIGKIRIPLFILPCGFSDEWAKKQIYAITKADVAMARDSASLKILNTYRPHGSNYYALDPILQGGLKRQSHTNLLPQCEFSHRSTDLDPCLSIIWIPRSGKLYEANTFTAQQQYSMQSMGHNDDAAIFFHPLTDSANGLEKIFDFCTIVKPDFFPWSINSHLSSQARLSTLATSLCISQRYHGCIWALLEGIRCLGISNDSNSKIFQLYHALACDEFCVDLRRFPGRQQLIDYSNSLDWHKLYRNLSVIQKESLQAYSQAYRQVFINEN